MKTLINYNYNNKSFLVSTLKNLFLTRGFFSASRKDVGTLYYPHYFKILHVCCSSARYVLFFLFIFLVVYFVFDFVLCFDCLPQSRDYSNAIVLMNSAASSDQFKSILIAHVKKYQNTVYKFMPYTSVSRNLDVAPAPEVGNVFIFTERVKELPPKTSFEDCVRNYSDCCVIVNPTNYNGVESKVFLEVWCNEEFLKYLLCQDNYLQDKYPLSGLFYLVTKYPEAAFSYLREYYHGNYSHRFAEYCRDMRLQFPSRSYNNIVETYYHKKIGTLKPLENYLCLKEQ